MRILRRFTRAGESPLEKVKYELRRTKISNPDGSVVFEMSDVETPAGWSQLASDILVSKYFRKAGVPLTDEGGKPILDETGKQKTGGERSVKQVINRLVKTWRWWGEKYGYFSAPEDAQAFEDELAYMLVNQYGAPNSPQWFNTGLYHQYKITGPSQGHYYVDPTTAALTRSTDSYSHPQPHACFILSIKDDLVNEGGIMDLWVREARLFKYGSGTGTNFSALRAESEPLSGGGYSSGLLSFLKIGDRAAGAIKSGGTTRRAAKMVILDVDHPDIEAFVNWKRTEEAKARILIEAGYSGDIEGEAYNTVSGQNSNNSVRVSNKFIRAVKENRKWELIGRVSKKPLKTIDAAKLWDEIAAAAYDCADPGVQFDTTINEWHTCPAGGRINASNPCSEYMFLDDTACNLMSLNLMKFYDAKKRRFDVEAFRHAVRLWTIVLEISVLMAQFPDKRIAQNSYDYRTLGLGYANLGTLLMVAGIPYDSDEGRAWAGALTAIMTGEGYAASAEMAAKLGPFPKYEQNAENMLRVIRNHRRAAYNAPAEEYEGLSVKPKGIEPEKLPEYLLSAAREAWDRAYELGRIHGFRNAQISAIAPTGTIGLLMDCDTTGVEPDFALVKFKKLAGGGYFKIANQSLVPALKTLGYSESQIADIMKYVMGRLSLKDAPHINRDSLKKAGFTDADISHVEEMLPRVFDLKQAFTRYALGEDLLNRLGFNAASYTQPDFNLLSTLKFTESQIEEADEYVCGAQTVEGAPHIKEEHLPVFDCANRCGKRGKRFISHAGHIKMMAAVQPFVSGAISKTVNMPNEIKVSDIRDAYMMSWEMGLKAISIYRDGSKAAQPLASKDRSKKKDKSDEKPALRAAEGKEAHAPVMVRKKEDEKLTRPIPLRARLPKRRKGFTVEARISNQKIYLRTGEYEDGTLGEIFIDMHKEGASFRSLLNSFAIAVSLGLQYGVPLEEFVEVFSFTRFDPQGIVDHPHIKSATSVIDYIFRLLAFEYLGRRDLVQSPPAEKLLITATKQEAEKFEAARTSKIPKVDDETLEKAMKGDKDCKEKIIEQLFVIAQENKRKAAQAATPDDGDGKAAAEKHVPVTVISAAESSLSKVAYVATTPIAAAAASATAPDYSTSWGLNQQLSQMMGDAPICDICGNITVRNGTCYRCLNCGHSMGCS
ncbi:MAG: hypothetical protein Kow0090_10950 [Myxococcota bacterium]